MKRIYKMKNLVMDKARELLDYASYKFLYASGGVAGITGAIVEHVKENPSSSIYFFSFGSVALAGAIMKAIRDQRTWKAEEKRKQEEHELRMQKERQEMQQDQDKHKKDLDKL